MVGSAARSLLLLPVKTRPEVTALLHQQNPTLYLQWWSPVLLVEPHLSRKLLKSDTYGRVELEPSFDKPEWSPTCFGFALHSLWSECLFVESMEVEVYLEEAAWKEILGDWISNRWQWSHTGLTDCRRGIFPHEVYHRLAAEDFLPLSVVFLRFATSYFVICCGHSVCTEYLEASKTALLFGFAV